MDRIRVLFVSSQLSPLSGDSELGDIAYSLTRAFASWKGKVTVVAPVTPGKNPESGGLARRLEPLRVDGAGDDIAVEYFEGTLQSGGVEVVLADVSASAEPQELLARVALTIAKQRGHRTHVVQTWADTPAAVYLAKDALSADGPVATVLTISDPSVPISAELQRAIDTADRVLLPSPSYTADLLASGEGELEAALAAASDRVRGVLAGVDEARWNPARDHHLTRPFSADDVTGKPTCKLELQREVGLPPRTRTPLVGAFAPFDLLDGKRAEALVTCDAQFVFLIDPNGDENGSNVVRDLARRHPSRVAVLAPETKADREALTHRTFAGADFALFAHPFRPAGHVDLFPMRYGAIPIAPASGGYADVLVDYDHVSATGNAILFAPAGDDLVAAVRRAIRCQRRPRFLELVERVLRQDLSWRTTARRYADLYRQTLRAQKVDSVVA